MRTSPEAEPYSGGFNSISLYFKDDRWWISSWSTQYKDPSLNPSKAPVAEKLTDLNTEQFADVVKVLCKTRFRPVRCRGHAGPCKNEPRCCG